MLFLNNSCIITCIGNTAALNHSQLHFERLDQVLDFDSSEGLKLLNQITKFMYKWEGAVADNLDLNQTDVAYIKEKYPCKLDLQT